jgi:hypothetical protein
MSPGEQKLFEQNKKGRKNNIPVAIEFAHATIHYLN